MIRAHCRIPISLQLLAWVRRIDKRVVHATRTDNIMIHLDAKELKRTLLSLTSGQHQLLLKKNDSDDTTTQEISPLDTFIYNSEFISSSSRLKVSVPQADPSADEYRKGSPSKALLDQQHQVRITIQWISTSHVKWMVHVDWSSYCADHENKQKVGAWWFIAWIGQAAWICTRGNIVKWLCRYCF